MKSASLDSFLPLNGTYYYCTGQTPWVLANATALTTLLASESPPEFRTALAICNELDGPLKTVNWDTVRYSGPFYADFDAGDDLPLVCEKFKEFLVRLDVELGFDLTQARLYASGSKGFHIEIPQECFIPKPPLKGFAWLPYIYRYMAQDLAVETLDFSVYSGKRGRMWRVPNRQRSNGMFKVPMELEEARNISPDILEAIIRNPRPFPPLTPANANSRFCMLFDRAYEAVTKKFKAKQKTTEMSYALQQRFGGRLPPSLEDVARGKIPSRVGFNRLAVQLCATAHAVGLTESDLIAICQGLCKKHDSDSTRYNTHQKREAELRRLYAYFAENPYEFSIAGIRSVLPSGMRANDLRGL